MPVLIAFSAAFVFGMGLSVAGLTDPAKILAFLDVTGAWYPGPLVVLGLGVVFYGVVNRLVTRRARPFAANAWSLPARSAIDPRLVSGAVLFGVGWGLAGYCPGPALTGLAYGKVETLWFVLAMVAGGALRQVTSRGVKPARSRPSPAASSR